MALCLHQYRLLSLNYSAPPPKSLVITTFSIILISFLVVFVLSYFFLIKYKTFLGHALTLLPLSPQKVLYLIKRCSCFVLSVYFCSSSLPLSNPIGFSLTRVVSCIRTRYSFEKIYTRFEKYYGVLFYYNKLYIPYQAVKCGLFLAFLFVM